LRSAQAARHGFDAREQLPLAHRLGDVVVGARLQPARDVVVPVARGGEDHERGRHAGADFLQDLQAVGIGKMPVEQVQVEGFARKRALQRVPAVEVVADMAACFQPLADEPRLVGVVLEVRDAHTAAVRLRRARRPGR
jgi:hypothetical protein